MTNVKVNPFILATYLAFVVASGSAAETPVSGSPATSKPKNMSAADKEKLRGCTEEAKRIGIYINNEPVPLSPAQRREYIRDCTTK